MLTVDMLGLVILKGHCSKKKINENLLHMEKDFPM